MTEQNLTRSERSQVLAVSPPANVRPKRNATEEEGTLGALLRLPYEAMAARVYGEIAAEFPDIRPAHSSVFRNILPEGSRLTDMAERAQITKQSMAYLVDYLHERGYVSLGPDPVDGRAKRVQLTEKGETVLQRLLEASRRMEAEAAVALGVEGLAALRSMLKTLAAHLGNPVPGGM